MRVRAALALAAGALLLAAPAAKAGAPLVLESWVEAVTATSVKLRAKINPNGPFTTYRFEYVTQSAYEKSGFAGAIKVPASGKAPLGGGTNPLEQPNQTVGPPLNPLTPATPYRYRAVAENSEGTAIGPEHVFATQEVALTFHLPDNRGWEMVSPIDKGGGAVAGPGTLHGGGDLQAARTSAAIAYGSSTAFGEAKGAPPVSQYLSTRTPGGWATQNVSAPLASAAYGDEPDGAPYRLFSEDLSRGVLFGGLACRGDIGGCPAPNPVLAGSGAPVGHMAYYLRDSAGSFSSLLTSFDLSHTSVSPEAFEVSFSAASPDLSHVVLASCAALSANATEVMLTPDECDPEEPSLYERSSAGLRLINLLPGGSEGTTGAQIAAPIGVVSSDGSRVYWTHEGDLYLRDGSQSVQVDEAKGGGGSFQVASSDGSIAFFTKEGHLYRFLASTKALTDLTPSGGVAGVLGASASGGDVYYQDASGINHWHEGTTTQVAPGAEAAAPGDYPPATATSRVSPDGSHLLFLSTEELTGYDNAGQAEAFLYGPPAGGGAPQLFCASCNPTGERPQGEATFPGALANGSTRAYKPRALTDNGQRVFFDSTDELVVQDSNSHPDVYQWEAKGVGDCNRSPGCVSLLSSGRFPEGATFVDASTDGTDAYFLTEESLIPPDPGSIDLYDARTNGGFPIPPKPIPCIADACQGLPPTPEDPDPGTLVKNSGNPAQSFGIEKAKKKKHKKHHGKGKHKNSKGKYHLQLKRGGLR